MRLRGSVLSYLILAMSCFVMMSPAGHAQSGSQTLWAPEFSIPDDSLVVWCQPDSICMEISAVDVDDQDTLVLSLVSGPIDYPTTVFPYQFTTTVCFSPDAAGVYTFVWQLIDKQDHVVTDTVTYTVELGTAPTITDQSFAAELCDLRDDRELQLIADGGGEDFTFELISGSGTINPVTGLLTYRPDTSGTFTFEVAVVNFCGADTATITDQVVLNLPPHCIGFDSTVYLCDPEEICFDIFAFDPEGDPIQIEMVEGIGTFTQTTDTSGITCFTPPAVDSARYGFIFRAADSCILALDAPVPAAPLCCVDTVWITVVIPQPGELACPPDTAFKLCVPPDELPETFCLAGFTSSWDVTDIVVTHSEFVDPILPSVYGDTVCLPLAAIGFGTFTITAIGSDTCGHADTCTTAITVTGNNTPYVTLGDDAELALCTSEAICISATADDLDFDIADVVANYGTYDAGTNLLCFDVDTSGVYELILTATDECGATDSDTAYVTVTLNEAPIVALGDDTTVSLCEPSEICLTAAVTDANLAYVSTMGGLYDSTAGTLCFTADTSGTYVVAIFATDDCELTVADTAVVTVSINSAPTIAGLQDTSVYLCFPREICLDVVIEDADNDIADITVSKGTYADGKICFVPYNKGVYDIILTVIDSCGNIAEDTASVTITTDQDIDLQCPEDTTVFLCEPDTLCFPIAGIPDGAEVTVGGIATYWNAETQSICFFSDCCLENTLSLTVTTPCGEYSCEFTVSVQTNSAPLVILPKDTTALLCNEENICVPVGINDIDGNLAEVVVEGGTYDDYRNQICFLTEGPGQYVITVTAIDSCGAQRSDEMTVNVAFNQPPFINLQQTDTLFRQCEPTEVCIPFEAGDLDGNLAD
ncbi:MAG: PRC-barrel domain-containing protein, partial [candidate division Zixibacteria bacterium]|nr:PRC-barrel domain-containing protein [candidate division Zixibacteria bacterium]